MKNRTGFELAAAIVTVAALTASVIGAGSIATVSSFATPNMVSEINVALQEADVRLDTLEGGSTVGSVEPGYIIVGNASTVGVDVVVSGDITMATNGAVAIASGALVNADVNASAAIAVTKLAGSAPGYIIVGNESTQNVAVAVSGVITLATNGLTAFANTMTLTNVVGGVTNTYTIPYTP